MSKRRRGKFYISGDILDNPQDYAHIFTDVVVVKAVYDWSEDKVEYLAWSEAFDELPEGAVIPTYDCMVTGTALSHTWRRRHD